jgi:hypothetical protein
MRLAKKCAETLAKAMIVNGKKNASSHITRQLDPRQTQLLHPQRRSGSERSQRVRVCATISPNKPSANGVKDVVSSMERMINVKSRNGNPGLVTNFVMGTASLEPNVVFPMMWKQTRPQVLKAQMRRSGDIQTSSRLATNNWQAVRAALRCRRCRLEPAQL